MLPDSVPHQITGDVFLGRAGEGPTQTLAHNFVSQRMKGANLDAVDTFSLQAFLHFVARLFVECQG